MMLFKKFEFSKCKFVEILDESSIRLETNFIIEETEIDHRVKVFTIIGVV